MEKQNFTVVDIRKILRSNFKNIFWTGKIYDDRLCDYKDLVIEDFNKQSTFSFLFINKDQRVCEKDIKISNSNFKIYDENDNKTIATDLSEEWIALINKSSNSLNM